MVGGERKLKEWGLQQGWNGRRISEESASRIFSAPGSLAGSYDRLIPICDRVPRNSPRLIAYLNTRGPNDA